MQPIHWQKSTYSGDGSNCVEIAVTSNATHVRDSKKTGIPHLVFHSSAWVHFISYTTSATSPTQDLI
ncbi:DUF397 domain-containing protein [Streptomyces sp. NBC_00882]|uniref:DUF397 domain-containing protein n=1 Tax=Streptomyces TaxID=1883 RepID=UPI00386FFE1A|nr:DUF397 domain-containing protein [Streptomyces sp. NBC_00882]WSZ58507.1 DUF397 domain-containing protein [Streptomyces canus]